MALLAAVAVAGPFDPPTAEHFDGPHAAPGALARYAESMAILQQAVTDDFRDVAAWSRLADILEIFDRAPELTPEIRTLLARDLPDRTRAALRGLLGHLLVVEGRAFAFRGVVILGPGFRQQPAQLAPAGRKLFAEAVEHLREFIRVFPRAERERRDLAEALLTLDAEANAEEARRVAAEADALSLRTPRERPELPDLEADAVRLRKEAEELEQVAEDPDHVAALSLRKRALVVEFCSHTIPFEYDPTLFGPVSLLASPRAVNTNLTRTFRTRNDKIQRVAPQYYAPRLARQLELIEGVSRDHGAGAGAVLLAVLRRQAQAGPLAEAALAGLRDGRHEAVRTQLPALLDAVLLGEDSPYPVFAQRALVRLAVELDVKDAAPALARALVDDTDLTTPLDVAAALGALGGPGQAEALVAIAAEPARDVYFRRAAVGALGRIDAALLDRVPDEPRLELAKAAARYRTAPSEELLGRILAALDHEHEADDAAHLCVELGIREAIPGLESFLDRRAGHYAAPDVRDALQALKARGRG